MWHSRSETWVNQVKAFGLCSQTAAPLHNRLSAEEAEVERLDRGTMAARWELSRTDALVAEAEADFENLAGEHASLQAATVGELKVGQHLSVPFLVPFPSPGRRNSRWRHLMPWLENMVCCTPLQAESSRWRPRSVVFPHCHFVHRLFSL